MRRERSIGYAVDYLKRELVAAYWALERVTNTIDYDLDHLPYEEWPKKFRNLINRVKELQLMIDEAQYECAFILDDD